MIDYDSILTRIHIKDAKTKEEKDWALKCGVKSIGVTANFCNMLFIPVYNKVWNCIDHITKTKYEDITIAHPNYDRYYSKIVNTFANFIAILTGGLSLKDRKRIKCNLLYDMIPGNDGIYDIYDMITIKRW